MFSCTDRKLWRRSQTEVCSKRESAVANDMTPDLTAESRTFDTVFAAESNQVN